MKFFSLLLLVVSFCSFSAQKKTERLYDFDHKVFYQETRVSDGHYLLAVEADSYDHFEKQSVFLLRYAAKLCRSSQFSLVFETGVQEFKALPTHPRPYQPSLTATLQCLSLKIEPVN
ncbi:hypothetical protein [Pseudoalteromonas tunicata]|jgi:hypothetical protein|uniref:Putative secreted protein n=1 Tax=Pseudoalteromonas tunicata D2 TaxID=87626 RepID=A4CFV0_9GAMM|nr:hypothetical protein [Pseudoalteromonas tunicata]ATC96265.1 hypothetical protein PTUN_a4032 [Pseudoalteromonas tunicata]AXT31776.1 hypothetical protein D1819_13735 [Pseudoalteromonas tunicata]EAR26387.1 putative secreted protein [Pseudoalteromonas tunicata D2]